MIRLAIESFVVPFSWGNEDDKNNFFEVYFLMTVSKWYCLFISWLRKPLPGLKNQGMTRIVNGNHYGFVNHKVFPKGDSVKRKTILVKEIYRTRCLIRIEIMNKGSFTVKSLLPVIAKRPGNQLFFVG